MDRIVFQRRWKREQEEIAATYEGPDLISGLPDDVLAAIVTLLKPQEGARTAVLSRRWRHVWRAAPLNLDDGFTGAALHNEDRIRLIDHILSAHTGPVRRLVTTEIQLVDRLRVFHSFGKRTFDDIYNDWLRRPVFDSLRELVLLFNMIRDETPELPASALRFTSLRVLHLTRCSLLSAASTTSSWSCGFPCLTSLSLHYVAITEDLLHRIISSSPRIQSLVLHANSGHCRLRVSLPSLRYLTVMVSPMLRAQHLAHLVIEDAASLEHLLLENTLDTGPSVRIIGATNLKMIDYLATAFPIVALNDKTVFKSMVPVSLAEQFSTVKILALKMPKLPKLEVAIAYLTCFPCLEELNIKFNCYTSWEKTSLKDAVHCDPSAPVECLDHCLKTIVLESYIGEKPQVDFAKFFVERARILKVMKFYISGNGFTRGWLKDHVRQLNIKNRASRCARFLHS